MTVYSLEAMRAAALRTQGLNAADEAGFKSRRDALYRCVSFLGCVQIDTLQMVRRSQDKEELRGPLKTCQNSNL